MQWIEAKVTFSDDDHSLTVDLIADAGEDDASNASYNECTAQMLDSKAALDDAAAFAKSIHGKKTGS